ncbi:MAG TPA: hypothetical protein VHA33_22885 [Candidatus Angelobacter sp.]|jgi:hypothetical protein|nr:hypothetical protein [Candidatus Angelobacter sp.]
MFARIVAAIIFVLLYVFSMTGQEPVIHPATEHHDMNSDHSHADESPETFLDQIETHTASGTSGEPSSTPESMLMLHKGDWSFMLHGQAFLTVQQQSGARGSDKLFSTNWIMPMAQRRFGRSTLTLRTMLSFDPATVTGRFYPELFQQGETAFGKPIVDGQHPHDFLMEIAALFDTRIGERTLLSFYVAPVGDPAMGPLAYAHRPSAAENPLSPLGHHLADSTHIADDVVTVGITHRAIRLEASGFHGREPDEHRWDLDTGKVDSWSGRLTVTPGANWSGQYSFAHLTSPEELHPGEDVLRMTASISYNRPVAAGNWANLVLWGRNRSLSNGMVANSYLAESTLRFKTSNYVWGRIENVDRTSDLFAASTSAEERVIGRVQAWSIGYDHDIGIVPHLETALGAQATFYGVPGSLKPAYGSHPAGVVVFVRVRPKGMHHH